MLGLCGVVLVGDIGSHAIGKCNHNVGKLSCHAGGESNNHVVEGHTVVVVLIYI